MVKTLILALCAVLFISTVSALTVHISPFRSLPQLRTFPPPMPPKTTITSTNGLPPLTMLLRTRTTILARKTKLMLRPGTTDGGTWLRTEIWEVLKTKPPLLTGWTSEKTGRRNYGERLQLLPDLSD